MAIFTFTNIAVTLVTLYIARRTYWEATRGTHLRSLSKSRHAQEAILHISSIPWYIPTLGIDIMVSVYRAIKQKRLLELWRGYLVDANAHTIALTLFGRATVYLTDDPENVKAMLATHFEDWSIGKERIDSLSSYLGHGIFTTEGKAWKHSREMLRPCFERTQVADVSVFERHTKRLMDLLPVDGSTVDLQPLFHELTLDIATEFLFGRSTNSLDRGEESREVREFIEAFEYCQDPFASANYKKYGWLGLMLPDKKRKRSAQMIKDFADKIIDEEIASKATNSSENGSRYIFLDELLTHTSDRITIRSELLNILLAGRDTTAALLSNVIWELSRQPTILAKLRSEIADIISDTDIPTYEQLKEMRYLKAILNESQRLYPIVPSNSREAIADTFLPNSSDPKHPLLVRKGTYVAFNPYSMHRRPDIYGADADEFRPERWLEPGFRPCWAFMAFSGGPRICIGQNFAITEALYVVVRLVRGLEIERRDQEVWREKLTVTCTGDGGCKVELRKRKD